MRGQMTTSRDLRRERLAGNWGGASEHIGSRWEQVGMESLRRRLSSGVAWPFDGATVRRLVPLADDEALQLALSRAGLPNPDVVVALETADGIALQALDFKWNLEFASYGQIRAEATEALMQRRVRPLVSLLERELEADPSTLRAVDGLLVSPELPVNRWFLSSEQNQRQEYPIETGEVVFEDVNVPEFFEPLPGWEMARLLARLDRSESRLGQLETAEHFYRIGTGLLGAVAQLQVSVFVRNPPAVEATVAMNWFRSKVRPPSSAGFLQMGEKLMYARGQLTQRLKALTRSPYRFSDLADTLKARGRPLPEQEEQISTAEKQKWGDLLRRVAVEHREVVYRTGLKLADAGLSDPEALTRLEGDQRRLAERARASAEKLITAALAEG